MIKQFFLTVVVLLISQGCMNEVRPPKPAPDTQDAGTKKQQEKKAESEQELTRMDPELLYTLLAAEVAGQRGAFEHALDGYIGAAKETGDRDIAERATQIALFMRDTDKAVEAVSVWIKTDPNDVSARKAAILIYLNRGDQDAALENIRYWLKMNDGSFEKKMDTLVKILDKGQSTRLGVMQQLQDEYGNDPAFRYAFAVLAFSKNELDTASENVDLALEKRPDWDKAISLKARIVALSEANGPAGPELSEMVADNPDNTELGFVYGQYLIKNEDYEAARTQFEKVLANDPDNPEARFALAGLNLQLNDLDAAEELFLQLKDQPEWSDQAYLFLGRIENSRENYADALIWFDRITEGPMASEAGLNALLVLGNLGRYEEADRRIEALYQKYPSQSLRIDLVKVELLNERKQYEKSLAVLNASLEKHPAQPELLYSRALVAERLDRLPILEADLAILLEKNPDDVNALNALGYTLADKTSRFAEAEKYLDRAINLKPDDPVIIDSYGWLQYKLGNHEKALKLLRRAFDEHPDPEIAAHLGEVLWESGRKHEAREVWRRALASNPDSDYLLNVKDRYPEGFRD